MMNTLAGKKQPYRMMNDEHIGRKETDVTLKNRFKLFVRPLDANS
jgi:hypothetical protein